ncbi:MAG: phosphatase PAP2 family protein, partial [Litoreibacter sp.]
GGQGGAHAGGPSSTLLNAALATTHDSIVGFWEGDPKRKPPLFGTPGDDTDLGYLPHDIRDHVLDGELAPLWSVMGSDGHAILNLDGRPVFSLTRPSPDFFEKQLKWVRAYSDLRGDRIAEINTQTSDILSYFGAVGYLNSGRRKNTLALLYTVYRLIFRLEHVVKHLCRSARPIDLSHEVQPIIQTPGHSAYPSGHATESFAIATVLHHLMEGTGAKAALSQPAVPMAYRVASRIAINRTIAGVHFPVDSLAGGALGCAFGDAIVGLATGAESTGSEFDPNKQDPMAADADFNAKMLGAIIPDLAQPTEDPSKAPIFAALWNAARDEWKPA